MEQKLNSFIEVSPQSDFTIHNLPYGIFSRTAEGERQVGVAIGDWVIDLAALEKHGLLKLSDQDTYFNQPTLNKFIESGKANWSKVRKTLQSLLSVDNLTLQENEALRQKFWLSKTVLLCIYHFKYLVIPISILLKNMPPM